MSTKLAAEVKDYDGPVASIGVSNFEQRNLENILASAAVAPQVNQLLVRAGNNPSELLAYCGRQHPTAKAPL
ncbi:hypothetical protein [Amycolatopsis japonica]